MNQRKLTVPVALLAVIVVALLAINWRSLAAHYRFRRLFESIGLNAQGYPEYRHLLPT